MIMFIVPKMKKKHWIPYEQLNSPLKSSLNKKKYGITNH